MAEVMECQHSSISSVVGRGVVVGSSCMSLCSFCPSLNAFWQLSILLLFGYIRFNSFSALRAPSIFCKNQLHAHQPGPSLPCPFVVRQKHVL